MSTTKPDLLTADHLLRLSSQGFRGELIRGVLCETMLAGTEQGEVTVLLISALISFVRPQRLGRVVGTDTGVLLESNPDTVREPDVAFVSADRLPLDVRPRGYLEVVPDLVAEVISPNASPVEVNDKTQMWLRYGVRLVWEVDPEARTVTAHYPDRPYATFGEDDMLDGGDVLPGFSCPVRDIFDL